MRVPIRYLARLMTMHESEDKTLNCLIDLLSISKGEVVINPALLTHMCITDDMYIIAFEMLEKYGDEYEIREFIDSNQHKFREKKFESYYENLKLRESALPLIRKHLMEEYLDD